MHNLVGDIIRSLEPMSSRKTVRGFASIGSEAYYAVADAKTTKDKEDMMADVQSKLLFEMRCCIVDLGLLRLDAPTYTLPFDIILIRVILVLTCVRRAKITFCDLHGILRPSKAIVFYLI